MAESDVINASYFGSPKDKFYRGNLSSLVFKKYLFYNPEEQCNTGHYTGRCEWMTASHPEMITVDFTLVQITCSTSRTIYSSNLQWTEPYGW